MVNVNDATFMFDASFMVVSSDNHTMVSGVERCLANDLSNYFDDFDVQHGCEYDKVYKAVVSFGASHIVLDSHAQKVAWSGDIPAFFLVRYVGEGFIRTMSWLGDEACDVDDTLAVFTRYSELYPIERWLRLEKVVNEILGFEYMSIDDGKLVFSDTSKVYENLYLILSEVVMNPVKNKILLLTNFNELEEYQEKNLVKYFRLNNISGIWLK